MESPFLPDEELMDCVVVSNENITKETEFFKYIRSFSSKLDKSLQEKIQKLSSEKWRTVREQILEYFVTKLVEGTGASNEEVRSRLDVGKNRRGRPAKRQCPWVLG